MDEIICPECGRPNLPDAEKCWYCQIPLVKESVDENLPADDVAGQETASGLPDAPRKTAQAAPDYSEEIPDWLRRVRELKKADQPPEEEDRWRQQQLFSAAAVEKEKEEMLRKIQHRPAPQPADEPAPRPIIPAEQPSLDEMPLDKIVADVHEPQDEAPLDEIVAEALEPQDQAPLDEIVDEALEPQSDDAVNPQADLPDGFTPLSTDSS